MKCLHEISRVSLIRWGDHSVCSKCGEAVVIELMTTEEIKLSFRQREQEVIYWLADKFPMAIRKQWTGSEIKKWIREQSQSYR